MSPQAAALLSASPAAFEPPPPVSRDRLIAVLAEVDPGSRALLDLSVRWRVADERVARLLRTDADDIARRRAGVIEGVAGALGVDPLHGLGELRAALAELPAEAWGVPVPASAREAVAPGRASETLAPEGVGNVTVPGGAAPTTRDQPLAVGEADAPATTALESPRSQRPAEAPTVAPASGRSLPVHPQRRGRTVLAVAVGALLGAVIGRRFR